MLTASSTASVTSCFSVLMSRSEGTVAFIDRLYTCMTRERQGTVQVHVEQCRPYIKIASITSKGAVAQCKSIGVNVEVLTPYDFTIEFPLLKPNLYFMN